MPPLAHIGCNISCVALRRWITRRWPTLTSCWDRRSAIWLTVIWQTSNGYKRLSLSRWVVLEWDKPAYLASAASIASFQNIVLKRAHPVKMRCLLPAYRSGRAFQVLPYRQTLMSQSSTGMSQSSIGTVRRTW